MDEQRVRDLLAAEHPKVADPNLAQTLGEALVRGRAARPGLTVDPARFIRHAARHLIAARERGAEATDLVWEDLYLACACADGDAAAIDELERIAAAELPRVASRLKLDSDTLDELRQVLRQKLLLEPETGGAPKIAAYAGRGPLARWLGAAATRTALSLERARGRVRPIEDLEQAAAIVESPELGYLRERYALEYKRAFQDAIGALPLRSRLLLRMHLLDGLTLDEIARVYGVHRSSSWRALKAARRDLVDHARKLLEQRLKLTRSEFDSLTLALVSKLDLSLSRLLV